MTLVSASRSFFRGGIATLVLCLSGSALAQVVNVQPLVRRATEEGLHVELGTALEWSTGNVDQILVDGSLLLRLHLGRHRLIFNTALEYGQAGGADFKERLFAHLRHQAQLNRWLWWETFVQGSRDVFARIAGRLLAGGGTRFELVDNDLFQLAVATLYMVEGQRFSEGPFPDSGLDERNHRLSAYVTGRLQISPLLAVTHTTYYQPRFGDFLDDFRIYSQTALAVSLTKRLTLSVQLELAYYSLPPASVQRLDTATKIRLAVAL